MPMKRRRELVQLEFPEPPKRGGRRVRAGRKKQSNRLVHLKRPELKERFPVHITLRVLHEVGNLRNKERFKAIKRAFRFGHDRFGMRLNEFSVQTNHFHLIVEAKDKTALTRGLQGLEIRVAKAVNRASGRHGKVFADRYHAHILKTPTEVRYAVDYVRRNFHHHVWKRHQRAVPPTWRDPFSSASNEALWDLELEGGELVGALIVARPETWMLKQATAPPA
jgi:putative transposase